MVYSYTLIKSWIEFQKLWKKERYDFLQSE